MIQRQVDMTDFDILSVKIDSMALGTLSNS